MKNTLLCLFALAGILHGAGTELEGTRAPANTPCPSPEEARAKMSVPDGYEVRCWAHEPMVQNPVAMAWDARGRLWIVEAYEYPEGTPLPEEKRPFGQEAKDDKYHPVPEICLPSSSIENRAARIPKDRVVIIEDTDNDGGADKRTVFVEGLNLASAIICGDDGIYVGQQPHLLHFKDSNHDDKPDEWRVILTGFGREDTHELVNSFTWGPDGWLYMTHGVFTNSKVRRPGVPEKDGFKFDAGIGRCRPTQQGKDAPWEFEVFADGTSNPWGCDYDERGNFFVSACVIDHFFHMAPGGIYVRQGGAPENPYSYELLPSIVTHKHFRAAYAGIQIYQGGVYPKDTWGHAFIGNIHDNAIHEEVLTPVGATFKCEPRRDFLRANDGWFRPVSTRTGPDGNLWVMDWCDKYPCYQNAKANPEGVDRERGRVWRVVYTGNAGAEKSASASSDAPGTVKTDNDLLNVSKATSKTDNDLPNASKATAKTDNDLPNVSKATAKTGSDHPNVSKATSKTGSDHPNVLKATSKIGNDLQNVKEVTSKTGSLSPAAGSQAGTTPSAHRPADRSRPEKGMDLTKLSTPALVKLLSDSNNWMRRWARRELVERSGNDQALPSLESLVIDRAKPLPVRMEALWTLHLLQADGDDMNAGILGELLPDPEPGIRAWVARICGERFRLADRSIANLADKNTGENSAKENAALAMLWKHTERLDRLESDPDITVRLACAVSRQMTASHSLTVSRPLLLDGKIFRAKVRTQLQLGNLIEHSAADADAVLSFMIWRALEPSLADFASAPETMDALSLAAPKSAPLSHVLTYKAMRRLCDTREAKNLDLALDFLSKIKAHDVLLAHALDGLEKGQESGIIKPTKEFSALFAEFAKSDNADVRKHSQNLATLWGDPAAIDRIVTLLKDNATPEPARIAALQTLRKLRTDAARKAFAAVVAQVSDLGGAGPGSQPSATGFALEMIRAASDLGGEDFPATIASSWAKLSPSLQLAALGTLASRPTWTHAMLDAVKANKINATGFPATVRRQLATSKDKAIRDHAFKVLGAWKDSSDDMKALITAKKAACLTGEPDLAAGKVLFQVTCMVCHTFHGGGQKVGPELIGSGRSNLDALLANVIDPNQIIGNGYENVIVSTKDNRTLMGRVTEDTPSAVKLLAIGGAEQVVPRDQIAKVENTHQSLMPMGFGGLPDDQFRNLIWYVLAPPEEGPLTQDKKKLLSTSIDAAPAKKGNHSVDWESVSLWNPQWKVIAPEFDRTPIKLAEYHGKTNVLIMHPFEDKKTPAALEQKLKVEAGKSRLKFNVAADDRGDWQLRVVINGKEVKRMNVNHEPPRWHEVTVDLADRIGLEATIRLEAHATDWAWEFGYWNDVRLE